MAFNQELANYPSLHRARTGPTLLSDSDEDLAARAATDPSAFAEIHRRYVDRIYRYCQRRLRSDDEIEDATNQIFLNALEGLHRTRIRHVQPWLFSIAHNVVTDRYRSRRKDAAIDLAWNVPSLSDSPEEAAIAHGDAADLYAALACLTSDQRQVVELRLSGLTGPEIRTVLGRSRSWVDTTQFRALKRLRELLKPLSTDRKG
jgi:RNA polymerase sigma-70 factor (ECF subfamily)